MMPIPSQHDRCARCGKETFANATDGSRLFYVHLYPSDHDVEDYIADMLEE